MILTAKAKVAGVMGWPVGHSRSPRLHGWWLDQYGIDGAYIPLAVPPDRVIDVTRRSIEETAAEIMMLLARRQAGSPAARAAITGAITGETPT